MPSFFNKVFGRKKHDDKDASRSTQPTSDPSLLDGRYEAVSPSVSPSATNFVDLASSSKEKDKDGPFSLFRPKSRVGSPGNSQKRANELPHLSLNLPGPKENTESRALGIVFEADPESQAILDDAVIAAKRLTPLEALILVRACSQAITERGLETLGIMHPHWYSASPDIQRRLISLFIHSLAPKSRITTLSPTPTSPASAFESELNYTRSPHDVASVLRWGLRHLKLEGSTFGKDSVEWSWYKTFFEAERDSSYPPTAFSDILLPQLPAAHVELLVAVLEVISSLAAHAEANSISGSKLTKFLGLWMLTVTRFEDTDDWAQFYQRWERAARIFEHLFLARVRQETINHRLPTRLQELVRQYPYLVGSPSTDDGLLSRPRFSTRPYDALFVRVDTGLSDSAKKPKQHPVRLILDAFKAGAESSTGEHVDLWTKIKKAATESPDAPSSSDFPQLTRIFVDETIQLLSLVPADSMEAVSPTTGMLSSPIIRIVSPTRRRSSSLSKLVEQKGVNGKHLRNGSASPSPNTPGPAIVTDWAHFSTSGFGETAVGQPLAATLLDKDLEVTQPPVARKSSSKKRPTPRRSSVDTPTATSPETSPQEPEVLLSKLSSVHMVQIDEAFIDFWSDAVVDPISVGWPTFVICKLKPLAGVENGSGHPIEWVVIEQAYSRPSQLRPSSPDSVKGRTSSPKPSLRSDISGLRMTSTLAAARKRFSFFEKTTSSPAERTAVRRKAVKSPNVGELGEILAEEEEKPEVSPASESGKGEEKKGLGIAGVASAVVATGAAGSAAFVAADAADKPVQEAEPQPVSATSDAPEKKDETAPEPQQDSVTTLVVEEPRHEIVEDVQQSVSPVSEPENTQQTPSLPVLGVASDAAEGTQSEVLTEATPVVDIDSVASAEAATPIKPVESAPENGNGNGNGHVEEEVQSEAPTEDAAVVVDVSSVPTDETDAPIQSVGSTETESTALPEPGNEDSQSEAPTEPQQPAEFTVSGESAHPSELADVDDAAEPEQPAVEDEVLPSTADVEPANIEVVSPEESVKSTVDDLVEPISDLSQSDVAHAEAVSAASTEEILSQEAADPEDMSVVDDERAVLPDTVAHDSTHVPLTIEPEVTQEPGSTEPVEAVERELDMTPSAKEFDVDQTNVAAMSDARIDDQIIPSVSEHEMEVGPSVSGSEAAMPVESFTEPSAEEPEVQHSDRDDSQDVVGDADAVSEPIQSEQLSKDEEDVSKEQKLIHDPHYSAEPAVAAEPEVADVNEAVGIPVESATTTIPETTPEPPADDSVGIDAEEPVAVEKLDDTSVEAEVEHQTDEITNTEDTNILTDNDQTLENAPVEDVSEAPATSEEDVVESHSAPADEVESPVAKTESEANAAPEDASEQTSSL